MSCQRICFGNSALEQVTQTGLTRHSNQLNVLLYYSHVEYIFKLRFYMYVDCNFLRAIKKVRAVICIIVQKKNYRLRHFVQFYF